MIRKLAIFFAVGFACVGFIACNESTKEYVEEVSQSAAVRAFSLAEDKNVLKNLDSVFFSIDLINAQIFNADSLPYGTKITKLVPVIVTLDGASQIKLTVTRPNQPDTVYDYMNHSTDSIDFTNPVKLHLVSADGAFERNYTIRVNVHQTEVDSLMWSRAERTALPSLFDYPNEQHSTLQGENVLCLTRYQNQYCLATGNPVIGEWNKREVSFTFKPQVNTFTATSDALYILAEDGTLYSSTDGTEWTSTTLKWHAVYGSYNSTILGSVEGIDGWQIQQYPSMALTNLPEGMPVSGTSAPVAYSFEMAVSKQMMLVGGRKADGTLSDATWGFDGSNWACISKYHLPEALEGMVAVPYYTSTVNSAFIATTYPTIIAFGGQKADGTLSKNVYMSNDYGYTWKKASPLMQLPEHIPAMHSAQAFVFDITHDVNSRASKPIESWECPYIYLFGGLNESGSTMNTVWRGVINRLSYKPLQ